MLCKLPWACLSKLTPKIISCSVWKASACPTTTKNAPAHYSWKYNSHCPTDSLINNLPSYSRQATHDNKWKPFRRLFFVTKPKNMPWRRPHALSYSLCWHRAAQRTAPQSLTLTCLLYKEKGALSLQREVCSLRTEYIIILKKPWRIYDILLSLRVLKYCLKKTSSLCWKILYR